MTFQQVVQNGMQLYNFPTAVGTPNFWAQEMAFTQAFMEWGRQAAPFIAAGTPPGQIPSLWDPNSTIGSRQAMFERTNANWMEWFTGYSASDSSDTSFDLKAANASAMSATETPHNLVAVFDTAVGYESGMLYEISDPGSTVDTLLSFGELDNNTIAALETIGGQDFSDFYHFSISETNVFAATLNNLSANADLGLFDANGQLLASSEIAGTANEELAVMLEAGDYLLGVVSYDGVATNYDLGILADDGSSFVAAAEPFATAETAIF